VKVVAVSDLHGYLVDIPSCDLLLIAGDICPTVNHRVEYQEHWLNTDFRYWLRKVPARKIVGVAGNHDLIFQNAPHRVPTLPWTYLQDAGTEFEGFKIWGTPWQLYFFDWAFNLYEPDLIKKWALIPSDTDIIVAHSPPRGYGDDAPRGRDTEKVGSPGLLAKIVEIKPKLMVFGHIHEGRGQWDLDGTTLANVTVVDGKYRLVHPPAVFELTGNADDRNRDVGRLDAAGGRPQVHD